MAEDSIRVPIEMPAREGGAYEAIVCHGDGPAQLAEAAQRFGDRPRFLVADETVAALHGRAFRPALGDAPLVTMPSGERAKSLVAVEAAAGALLEAGVRRDAVLFALGGGALCDAAGFVAATLLRGMDHVLLPTTLLAMVDAAIGGKTAVDLPAGKNLLGAFHQPRLVLCDLATLTTLELRERRAGLAELLKHALLDGEQAISRVEERAERLRDDPPEALREVVRDAIAFKAGVVTLDPREQRALKRRARVGRSRPVVVAGREVLNLGHTIGHALESVSQASAHPLRHGEAVGLGLLAEARIARALNLWPQGPDRIAALLPRLGLPDGLDEVLGTLSVDRLRSALNADKKRSAGLPGQADVISFVLLDGPGRPMGVSLRADRALEILLGEKFG